MNEGIDLRRRFYRRTWRAILADRQLYLMILPGILFVFVFAYMPMYGLVLAFKTFKPKLGILGSPWCGWENFERFFFKTDAGYTIFNTLQIGFCNLLIGFPVPILLSLLLNELHKKTFKRSIQSILYLPHFVSWVVIFSLLYSLFSTTAGIINRMIVSFGGSALNVLSDPSKFKGLVYLTSIWKGAGWGTIIYMAAIAGVDPQMYEAATIDGANRFQQCLHVTLPAIAFSITTMLILNAGSVLGANFDQIMNLRTDPTMRVSQIIDTYVYDMGVTKGQYGMSTAIGLFQQIINSFLLFLSNTFVKRLNGEGFF
ncbi:MAG TPA: ABC transporter permease subunit [Clostridia bacterium]|nr:ABC transporter permease subunit [Clostridia bacterium]